MAAEQARFDEARRAWSAEQAIWAQDGDGVANSRAWLNVGVAWRALGNGAAAREAFEQSLDLARRMAHEKLETNVRLRLVSWELDLGSIEEAEHAIEDLPDPFCIVHPFLKAVQAVTDRSCFHQDPSAGCG
ncbi:MAG: hypothetical protein AAGA48_23880 [Myxococcota bacterium]